MALDGETTTLATIPAADALAVYTTEIKDGKHAAIDPILAGIRKAINEFKADVTTEAGRKAIASMAYKVSQSKAHLEKIGKALAAEQKKIPGLIDASRRHIDTKLEKWRDEVRKPLTDWEAAEEAKATHIKNVTNILQGVIDNRIDRPSAVVAEHMAEIKTLAIDEAKFGNFTRLTHDLKAKALAALEVQHVAALKRESDAAELEKLRTEAAARAKADAEAKAIADAVEQAKLAAERAAKAETDAALARERKLEADLAAAEKRAEEAAAAAKADAERKAQAEAAATAAREADAVHRADVDGKAIAALVANGIGESVAKVVVMLAAAGAIPRMTINY